MPTIDISDEKAEQELLELIRLQDVQQFTLIVTVDDGRWTVATETLDPPGKVLGEGSCFAEAWFSQNPLWAREGVR